jgi:outer membrane receptor protein involved in Fe transport
LKPAEALARLLRGTGLTFEVAGPRSFTIVAARPPAPPPPPPPPPAPQPVPEVLPVVEVTARRHRENVDSVPIAITVHTQEESSAFGIKSTPDIAARTPGMDFVVLSSVGAGVYTNMAIRGVSDRHGTVTEVFLDDIPIPEVRSNTFGRALPVSFDLDRVEVLRGPQGTIMGANTQGGAIRYVPNQPSFRGFNGGVQAEWATTQWGSPTYEAGSWLDGLITDAVGFRVSGWYRSDGGYVDRVDPFSGATLDADSDRITSRSFRGILTFDSGTGIRISPALSYESNAARDSSSFFTYLSPDPGAGDFNNGSLLRQPASDAYYLGTLKVTVDAGATQFSSVTAYFDRSGSLLVDDTETPGWGGWGENHQGYLDLGPEYPVSYDDAVTTSIGLTQSLFSEEIRFGSKDPHRRADSAPDAPPAASPDSPLAWFAALMYARERYQEADRVSGQHIPAFGNAALDANDTTTTVQDQWAVFADATRHVGGHFAVNAGVRVERDDYDSHDTGLTGLPPYPSRPVFHSHVSGTAVVPRFALNYEVDHDPRDAVGHYLFYLTAAKGFSPAGVDAALPTCLQQPIPYAAESLWSYEIGGKSSLFGGRLHLDAAAFHIRWDNGPVATNSCLFRHMPGSAASNGFELETRALAGHGFAASLAFAYTDSRYSQTVVDAQSGQVIVHEGDAVGTPPVVTSPWDLRATLEQSVPFFGATVDFRIEDLFRSRNPGPFYTSAPGSRFYLPGLAPDPSTNVLNLRTAVSWHRFVAQLYLSNALGAQPTLLKRNKGEHDATLYYATTFRPRTVGLAAQWRF